MRWAGRGMRDALIRARPENRPAILTDQLALDRFDIHRAADIAYLGGRLTERIPLSASRIPLNQNPARGSEPATSALSRQSRSSPLLFLQ